MQIIRNFFQRNWKPLLGGAALGALACHPNLAHGRGSKSAISG
jgi:hypothetical protein